MNNLLEPVRVCVQRDYGFSVLDPNSITCLSIRGTDAELCFDNNERTLHFDLAFINHVDQAVSCDLVLKRKIVVVCVLGLYAYPERIFQNFGEYKQLKQLLDLMLHDVLLPNEDHVLEVNQFLEALFNRPEMGYETN